MSCTAQETVTNTSEKPIHTTENTTTVIETPGGIVRIQGPWVSYYYDESSRQNFLKGTEGIIIAVAQNHKRAFPFYNDKLEGFEIIKAYTDWDMDFRKKNGNNASLIKENNSEGYQIWKFTDDKKIDNVFLYGINKDYILNFLIYTDKWEEDEKIEFLEQAYLGNKAGI